MSLIIYLIKFNYLSLTIEITSLAFVLAISYLIQNRDIFLKVSNGDFTTLQKVRKIYLFFFSYMPHASARCAS